MEVTPVGYQELNDSRQGEDSATIRKRVIAAREIQLKRYESNPGIYNNAHMSTNMIREFCELTTVSQNLLKAAMNKLSLSARAYERILKVARTIADLDASPMIRPEHIAEAIQYRSLDREGWGD